ncbi:hypothetical protein GCM10009682_58290 [Luedemannella flava]|uniref:Uncharacterized protein n=1 Tax=Luedemannella flava TaxID=349316 RepID=A0ABP4YVB3_9ACTN
MEWITERSTVLCGHDGVVVPVASQRWVRTGGAAVLVDNDPEGRAVKGCPNIGPTMKPCTTTLRVARGYSDWIRIGGRAVTLSNLDGLTDGTVPGTVHYRVEHTRQHLVRSTS